MSHDKNEKRGQIYLLTSIIILALLIVLSIWGVKGCSMHQAADNLNDAVVEHENHEAHTYVETATEIKNTVEINSTNLATSTQTIATSVVTNEKEVIEANVDNDTRMTDIILLPKDTTAVEQGMIQVKKFSDAIALFNGTYDKHLAPISYDLWKSFYTPDNVQLIPIYSTTSQFDWYISTEGLDEHGESATHPAVSTVWGIAGPNGYKDIVIGTDVKVRLPAIDWRVREKKMIDWLNDLKRKGQIDEEKYELLYGWLKTHYMYYEENPILTLYGFDPAPFMSLVLKHNLVQKPFGQGGFQILTYDDDGSDGSLGFGYKGRALWYELWDENANKTKHLQGDVYLTFRGRYRPIMDDYNTYVQLQGALVGNAGDLVVYPEGEYLIKIHLSYITWQQVSIEWEVIVEFHKDDNEQYTKLAWPLLEKMLKEYNRGYTQNNPIKVKTVEEMIQEIPILQKYFGPVYADWQKSFPKGYNKCNKNLLYFGFVYKHTPITGKRIGVAAACPEIFKDKEDVGKYFMQKTNISSPYDKNEKLSLRDAVYYNFIKDTVSGQNGWEWWSFNLFPTYSYPRTFLIQAPPFKEDIFTGTWGEVYSGEIEQKIFGSEPIDIQKTQWRLKMFELSFKNDIDI